MQALPGGPSEQVALAELTQQRATALAAAEAAAARRVARPSPSQYPELHRATTSFAAGLAAPSRVCALADGLAAAAVAGAEGGAVSGAGLAAVAEARVWAANARVWADRLAAEFEW